MIRHENKNSQFLFLAFVVLKYLVQIMRIINIPNFLKIIYIYHSLNNLFKIKNINLNIFLYF